MPEFMFTGRVTLDDVMFFIEADTEAEAKEKAKRGDFDHRDTACAEMVDWQIMPSTCSVNE